MNVIYLQEEESLCGRTWCEDKINDSDVEYVLNHQVKNQDKNKPL